MEGVHDWEVSAQSGFQAHSWINLQIPLSLSPSYIKLVFWILQPWGKNMREQRDILYVLKDMQVEVEPNGNCYLIFSSGISQKCLSFFI